MKSQKILKNNADLYNLGEVLKNADTDAKTIINAVLLFLVSLCWFSGKILFS